MKKYFLIVVLFSFVLFGCTSPNTDSIDVNSISDLSTLEAKIAQISEALNEGTIDPEIAQQTVEKLQQKYLDLKNMTSTTIEDKFATIKGMFIEKNINSYSIPLWAKQAGITQPKGLFLDTELSHQAYTTEGYDSTTLVYTGEYTLALQEAERIAKQAGLFLSSDFEKGQALAQNTNTNYISGLNIDDLTKGVVYVNHELLETNVDNLLSVSVDQDGTLTIEVTKYN